LVNLERQKLDDEYREVLKTIAYLEDILSDPRRVLSIIKQETRQMKERLGDARRTRIVPIEAEEIGEEDVIPEETTVVTITRDGYIKRMPIDTYRVQGRGGRGIISGRQKADDSAAQLFVATTHHYILFFTDQGRVYRLRAYEIPQASRTAMGTAIVNLIDIQPGESITASVPVQDLDGDGFLLMVTQNGEIKRTPAAEFRNIRSAGIRAFDLEEGDTLRWVQLTTGEDEVVIVTRNGMSIRFPEAEVPARSRGAGGVKAISLENGDCVVGMDLCRNGDDLLVVSEKAYGKRTSFSEYRAQSRGGKGILTMRVTEKTGRLVGCLAVKDTDRIMLMTANGVCIQLPVDSIRQSGRSTQGVILQSLAEGDTVVSIERVREEQNGD
jgi:DNA gyrase subunit A